jgi:SAM-dependent methyltransferase
MTTIQPDDYRQSHLGADLAASYHDDFTARLPGRYWQTVEQDLLRGLLAEATAGPLAGMRHLDVASGSGRVLAYLQPRTAHSTALDISEAMLAHARAAVPAATFVVGDASTMTLGQRFELVTAFRFFLNAGPELRAAVLDRVRQHLSPDGLLVANIHAQPVSSLGLWRRLKRRLGRPADSVLSIAELEALLWDHGYEVVAERTYGYLPLTRRLGPGLPSTAFCATDRLLNRLLPARNRFACCWLVAARARP